LSGDGWRKRSSKLFSTSSAKHEASRSKPPDRAERSVIGCAPTNIATTTPNVSPASDFAKRYESSKKPANTSVLNTKAFVYE
jgi:hypothetical protein